MADGYVVAGTGYDPELNDGEYHAGYVVVYQFDYQGDTYKLHQCHGQSLEVQRGQKISKGQVIGHVGYSGTCWPQGIAGSHTHVWCECLTNGVWVRIRPTQLFG